MISNRVDHPGIDQQALLGKVKALGIDPSQILLEPNRRIIAQQLGVAPVIVASQGDVSLGEGKGFIVGEKPQVVLVRQPDADTFGK